MADWKKELAKFAGRVETKLDEQRDRLGLTGGRVRRARIEAYRSFGCADRAYVRGRVLRGAPIASAGERDGALLNLASMLQRFESDEVPVARVRVHFPGGEHEVTADGEGYFECWFQPRPPFAPHALWHEVRMELAHPVEGEPHQALAHLLVPPEQSAFGVISDLDDTVVRTDVTSALRMMRNVFLQNARTRVPFPGVAAFYRALEKGAGPTPFNPIFYVSSSPWNLHDLLTEFLVLQKIPLGPLLLRDWGLTPQGVTPLGGNEDHKLESIRRIMGLFPALRFILIGDSGQEDPEIYLRAVREFPDRVLAVYIRNVHPRPERADTIRALALEVEAAGSALLLADDTLAAARHAAGRGWIAPGALAEIGAVTSADAPTAESGTEAVNRDLSTVGPS